MSGFPFLILQFALYGLNFFIIQNKLLGFNRGYLKLDPKFKVPRSSKGDKTKHWVLQITHIVHLGNLWFMDLFCTQGVLRLRKRVTLMVVTVSTILVISWGADGILHLIHEYADSVKLSPLTTPIAHTIMIFNSAVNPFAYALLNQRFRKKMKQMACPRSFATRVHSVSARQREQQDNEVANSTGDIPMTQKTNWVTGWRQFPGKTYVYLSPCDLTLCRIIRFSSFFCSLHLLFCYR